MQFFWKEVGGVNYLKEYTSIVKDSDHIANSGKILLPFFLFWLATLGFFPFILFKFRKRSFIKDFPPYYCPSMIPKHHTSYESSEGYEEESDDTFPLMKVKSVKNANLSSSDP